MKLGLKKIIAVIAGIAIILLIVYFVKSISKDNSEPFIVKDFNKIEKIIISKNLDSVFISQINDNQNKWLINSKYQATDKSINKLKQVLTETKIKAPVKKEKIDSVNTALTTSGKKIQITGSRGRILKEWLIGTYEDNIEGTYIRDFKGEKPYIINIPGLANDLDYRYNINILYWIKAEIFSYNPNEITEVHISYNDKINKSFKLFVNGGNSKIVSEGKTYSENIDLNKLGSYLSYFMNVNFSSFYNSGSANIDSIKSLSPDFTISIRDIYENKKDVKLYKILLNDSIQQYDQNKLNALINDEDLVIVKYIDIDLILKDPSYFTN